jgi:hypothetical protein
MPLIKRQRNEIYEALELGGVDPADYELTESSGRHVLIHPSSNSKFDFAEGRIGYEGIIDVGGVIVGTFSRSNWSQILSQIVEWAYDTVYEVDTPDRWEQLKNQSNMLDQLNDEGLGNTPFTPAEQTEIAERLEEVKKRAKELPDLSADQVAQIEQRIDEAAEASQRVGRKDWLLLLYGTAFNLIVTDLVPPNVVQGILSMALHGVAHIFGIGGPPPSIPPQA